MTERNPSTRPADSKERQGALVIECPACVARDQEFTVRVTARGGDAADGSAGHRVSWVSLYFHPDGATYPDEIGHFDLAAGDEMGAKSGSADRTVVASMKTGQPGTLHALALSNTYGLTESSRRVEFV